MKINVFNSYFQICVSCGKSCRPVSQKPQMSVCLSELLDNSSSPACESVLPVNSAWGGSRDSSWLRPALRPPALPDSPAAQRSPPPPAAGEPVPERASSAGPPGLRLHPAMWTGRLVEGLGGPDTVPPAKRRDAAPGSPSSSRIWSGRDWESLLSQPSQTLRSRS